MLSCGIRKTLSISRLNSIFHLIKHLVFMKSSEIRKTFKYPETEIDKKWYLSTIYWQFNAPITNMTFFIYVWLSYQDFKNALGNLDLKQLNNPSHYSHQERPLDLKMEMVEERWFSTFFRCHPSNRDLLSIASQ